ncbi:MAG: hypothetical protein ACFN9G_03690 [Cardiobacterium sp.]|jgi:hypothetical protein
MNHEKPKKSRSAPSDGIIAWLYGLLFSRKNAVTDEMPTPPARESIPEHDNGRAEKLFAQMQQEQESTTPAVQAASTMGTRTTTHQDDDSGASIHHAASDGGSSSSSCDSDSGSSGCD